MIKHALIANLLFISLSLGAQNWAPLGKGFDAGFFPRTMVADAPNNRLILGGDFKWINSDGLPAYGVATWNGVKWDSLGYRIQECPTCNSVSPVTKLYWYKNQLYADGHFQDVDMTKPYQHAKFNPSTLKWENLILCQYVNGGQSWSNTLNDSLVISGVPDTVCYMPRAMAFFYDGNSFYSFAPLNSLPPGPSGGNVTRYLFKYKGIWYVAGYFYDTATSSAFYFARFNGTGWESVPGFENCPGINKIKIFNNELYITGSFYKATGIPGNGITKFDGIAWFDLGGGVQTVSGRSNDHMSGITDFTVYNGELYTAGYYYDQNLNAVSKVAKFDGTSWCTSGDNFDNQIDAIAFLNDTLYAAGAFQNIGGQVIQGAAKYTGNGFSICNTVGINEAQALTGISIYPNPAISTLTIKSDQNIPNNSTIQVQNYLGQTVLACSYAEAIDISSLTQGCYLLNIYVPDRGTFHTKFIVSH